MPFTVSFDDERETWRFDGEESLTLDDLDKIGRALLGALGRPIFSRPHPPAAARQKVYRHSYLALMRSLKEES